ncbi:hypothetical protein OIO90_006341 [Microbotryomycetes sp. JL221]|nr:hypothetical protein OIO90_006341 [Microbotryomycetes sp. JL221]
MKPQVGVVALLSGLSALGIHASPVVVQDGTTTLLERRFVNATIASACKGLTNSTSVYGALSIDYIQDTSHYMSSSCKSWIPQGQSSSHVLILHPPAAQPPTCLVKPRSAEEVSNIIKIVGARRIPFAISTAGHASNPGFSSTKGVHMTLNGLTLDGTNSMLLNADKSELTYTPGHVWDDLYQFMLDNAPGRMIVGGRVSGVGVGGFVVAGGGYSWLSNQYGLTIDTVKSMQVVLPSGQIVTASDSENSDLFFGVRGAGNEFGVVTSITVKTFPSGPNVYGGIALYDGLNLKGLAQATTNFSRTNRDPKASVLPTFNAVAGLPGAVLIEFYDGEKPPVGTFSAFEESKSKPLSKDFKTRSWLSLVKASPADATAGQRGAFHTISVIDYSPAIMDAILQQVKYYASISLLHSATFVSYDVEPFVPSYFDYSNGGAYPHTSARPLLPLNIYVAWTNPLEDKFWRNEMKKSAELLLDIARKEGQAVDPQIRYPNYALADTPLVELYGEENLARLRQIKRKFDPSRVMDLAGGFKIPF